MSHGQRLLGFLLFACALWACTPTDESLPLSASALVVDIVDGDTITISLKGRRDTVRLIGIDTPETKKPSTPIECFGPEATEFLSSLIPPGTILTVHRDVESRDHFGRLLAYVFRHYDGLFVNREILYQGFARPLPIAPNITYDREFEVATSQARKEQRGLWKACR